MMDEMDEVCALLRAESTIADLGWSQATALMPAEVDKSNTPQQVPFLSLDADGMLLPDTWYM
jgi:hypothetical protein